MILSPVFGVLVNQLSGRKKKKNNTLVLAFADTYGTNIPITLMSTYQSKVTELRNGPYEPV